MVSSEQVQEELEGLNAASRLINELENELCKIRWAHKDRVAEYGRELEVTAAKLGRSVVQRARAYYDTVEAVEQVRLEVVEASSEYIHSQSAWEALANTAYLAQALCQHPSEKSSSSAQNECLSIIREKLQKVELTRASIEREHKQKSIEFQLRSEKVKYLERTFSRSIKRAKPYFELRKKFNKELKATKAHYTRIQSNINIQKKQYANALRNLEAMSDKIRDERLGRIVNDRRIKAKDLGRKDADSCCTLENMNFLLNDNPSISQSCSFPSCETSARDQKRHFSV